MSTITAEARAQCMARVFSDTILCWLTDIMMALPPSLLQCSNGTGGTSVVGDGTGGNDLTDVNPFPRWEEYTPDITFRVRSCRGGVHGPRCRVRCARPPHAAWPDMQVLAEPRCSCLHKVKGVRGCGPSPPLPYFCCNLIHSHRCRQTQKALTTTQCWWYGTILGPFLTCLRWRATVRIQPRRTLDVSAPGGGGGAQMLASSGSRCQDAATALLPEGHQACREEQAKACLSLSVPMQMTGQMVPTRHRSSLT
jgi:hypothetical protein